jgi:hypothetical protein
MDMDFAVSCQLVRHRMPLIRFLYIGSRLCSTLPSDAPSPGRPCASLLLHLHQVVEGTFTPELSNMLGIQQKGGAAWAPPFSLPGLSACLYQKNLNRTWICRGIMFCVETVEGKTLPKAALLGSVLRSVRPK